MSLRSTTFGLAEALRLGPGRHPRQSQRRFLDFQVDGEGLRSKVQAIGGDAITGLWLDPKLPRAEGRRIIARLLGEEAGDATGGRLSIYGCPECWDIGCGAFTVVLKRTHDEIEWTAWGYQNNYQDGFEAIRELPELRFSRQQYESVLRAALPLLVE